MRYLWWRPHPTHRVPGSEVPGKTLTGHISSSTTASSQPSSPWLSQRGGFARHYPHSGRCSGSHPGAPVVPPFMGSAVPWACRSGPASAQEGRVCDVPVTQDGEAQTAGAYPRCPKRQWQSQDVTWPVQSRTELPSPSSAGPPHFCTSRGSQPNNDGATRFQGCVTHRERGKPPSDKHATLPTCPPASSPPPTHPPIQPLTHPSPTQTHPSIHSPILPSIHPTIHPSLSTY
jgi:hypothetical protein